MIAYRVIEDNAGGLHLAILVDGCCRVLCSGYEHEPPADLMRDIDAAAEARESDLPDWTGSENPEADYRSLTADTIAHRIVADANGIYPGEMGVAAMIAFGVQPHGVQS